MNNEVRNYYKILPKKYIKKVPNPSYNNHLINLPFRILIVGASGSGKTQLVLELLDRMRNTFEKVVLCVKNADEPLYQWLRDKLTADQLDIFEGSEAVPNIDSLAGKQTLIVFDDLVLEKNQNQILQAFIRGRKLGLSMVYLTQSYYQTPKTIRINCNYLFLKKLSNKRDLTAILNEYGLGLDKSQLIILYKYAIESGTGNKKGNFLMIDADADEENRFRKNFLKVLNPDELAL